MFIRNRTGSYQGFRLNNKPVKLGPYGVTAISDLQASDDTLQLLLARNVVEKISQKEAQKEFEEVTAKAEEKAEKTKLDVVVREETNKNSVMMAQCCAKQKNGETCAANVSVPVSEYDSDKPYFCGRHKAENPEDYEKVNGGWVKKAKPESKPELEPETKDKQDESGDSKGEEGVEDKASKAAEALLR